MFAGTRLSCYFTESSQRRSWMCSTHGWWKISHKKEQSPIQKTSWVLKHVPQQAGFTFGTWPWQGREPEKGVQLIGIWAFWSLRKHLGPFDKRTTRWWFQIFSCLGKIPILTNICQMGWNHQPYNHLRWTETSRLFWRVQLHYFLVCKCMYINLRCVLSKITLGEHIPNHPFPLRDVSNREILNQLNFGGWIRVCSTLGVCSIFQQL